MSADHEAVRPLLGAFLLGGLDAADQFRVDGHLRDCAECRAEVGRLAPVIELLQRLPGDHPAGPLEAPPRAGLRTLLRKTRRRRSRLLVVAVAAAIAAVVVVAAALAFGVPRKAPQPAPSASNPGTVVQFVAAAGSGLAGRATLTPRQWGTSVALEVSGLPGDGPFVLRVVGRGGQAEQAACWGRTTSASARVTGASSIQLPNVDAVTVSDQEGHVLGSAHPS